MQHKKVSAKNKKTSSLPPFSYRVAGHLAPRFNAVLTVSRRSKASILHEALERALPELEKTYQVEDPRQIKFA